MFPGCFFAFTQLWGISPWATVWSAIHGKPLNAPDSFLLCNFQFGGQSAVDYVGAIIDRPAYRCCVFALGFGEFVIFYGTGAQ